VKYSYVVVGAGLTGSVIARCLADAGQSVVVVERRSRIGGNVADATAPSGIQVHLHGPHLFRTASEEIWRFVGRFASFHPYRHQIKSRVDGTLENWPIGASCIRRLCGVNWKPERNGGQQPTNFEEAALSLMPRVIYEQFVKGYTEKQWGVPAVSLSAALCSRFDVREDDDPYLHPRHKYQGIPTEGYSRMVERMLEGIPVCTGFDYLNDRNLFKPRKLLVFTGPIDEYFGFLLGKLAYRGQRRTHSYHADADWLQPCAQVNDPGEPAHIRDIEWKHIMRPDYAGRISGTLITRETPWSPDCPDDYEYPFPDDRNQRLYEQYRRMADKEPGVLICGRLGEYRYYDMDHAIGRAMALVKDLLQRDCTRCSSICRQGA
jgi:UDP-galactopyranose mutase